MKAVKLVPIFSLAAACAAAISAMILRPSSANIEPRETHARIVDVVEVKKGALDKTEHFPADLLPYEAVDVYAKVSGFIEKLYADRGSEVDENAVLARLVAPELDESIEAERAKYRSAQDQYQRNKRLGPGAIVSAQTIESLKDAAESERETIESLEAQKGYLTIAAPFHGVITTRNLHTGAFVIAGGSNGAVPLFRLERLDRLRLVVAIPEAYVGGVTEGMNIPFAVPAYPDRMFSAKVARVASSLDLRTRSESVELDVDNRERVLLPGMYADVSWPVRRRTIGFIVPAKAIAITTERSFLIRVTKEGVVEWVDAKRGAAADGRVEVFGSLHEGDLISRSGTDEIKPGSKVAARLATE